MKYSFNLKPQALFAILVFIFTHLHIFTFKAYSQKGDIWLHLLQKNLSASPYLGNYVSFWVNMEIGQASWNQSDLGYGESGTDPAKFAWQPAEWYENGNADNKRVHSRFSFQATPQQAVYYFAGRARDAATDPFHYANDTVWGNNAVFSPKYTITITPKPLPIPSGFSAVSKSPTQMTLSWTADAVYKNVMIVCRRGSDISAEPVQGKEYLPNAMIGGGSVIYKGSLTSFLQTGLMPSSHYYYRIYTVNNNYYSDIDMQTIKDAVTVSAPPCTFKVNAGKDTTVCGLGSVILNPGFSVSPFADSLVITYDASKGVTELKGSSKVYMHSGVELHKFGGWQYVVGNWGKDDGVGLMKKIGTDLWQIKIMPRNYYGYPADSTIYGIFMVFRNQDTLIGKDYSNNDIHIDMSFLPPVSSFDGVNLHWIKGKYNYIKWSDGSSNQNLSVSSSGNYSVIITDINGCEGKDTVKVKVSSLPNVELGKDTSFCEGGSAVLKPGSFAAYKWSDGSTGSTLTVTKSGTYFVTVTNSDGCSGFDFRKITVDAKPAVELGPDTSACEGSYVTLDAGAAYKSYSWKYNDQQLSAGSYLLQAAQAGKYSVTVTTAGGCRNSDSVNVAIHPNPVIVVKNDTAICEGAALKITASGAESYLWNIGEDLPYIWVSPTNDITYTVTGTNQYGCSSVADVAVTVVHFPEAAFSIASSSGLTYNFTNLSQNASAFKWDFDSDGSFDNTSAGDVSYTYLHPGEYTAMLVASNSCGSDTMRRSVSIVIDTLPPVAMFDYEISGKTVNLTDQSQNAKHYAWSFYKSSVIDDTAKGNVSHTYSSYGQYNITLKVTNDFGSDSYSRIVLLLSVSELQTTNSGMITIYPNPVNDRLNIKLKLNKLNDLNFRIVNLMGESIFSENCADITGEYSKSIDLNNIKKGVYILYISSDSDKFMFKFVNY